MSSASESRESGLEIPAAWASAAARIVGEDWRRTLVIGRSDRGKSSFCRYLLQRLIAAGAPAVYFVDADIAQKDIGPPATVSVAMFGAADGEPFSFSAGRVCALHFVGTVTPQGHFLDLVVGTRRLAERAGEAPTVIDTTGLVSGPGRELKRAQIESLEPDGLVMLERAGELDELAMEHAHRPLIRLAPAAAARRRSPALRRAARERAFAACFDRATEIELVHRHLVVQRGPPSPGLLCAAADARDEVLGLARVAYLRHGSLGLTTGVRAARIRILKMGGLWISRSGRHRPLARR